MNYQRHFDDFTHHDSYDNDHHHHRHNNDHHHNHHNHHNRDKHNHHNSPERSKRRRPRQIIQPCYSGVSLSIFTVMVICVIVAIYLMEGPFLFMDIIYSLYLLIIGVFVIQILADLGLWVWTQSGNPGLRNFLCRLCPILCLGMSIPPAGLLWHTKNRGGFTTETTNISLVCSLVVVILELFHLLMTLYIYRNHGKKYEESSVRFSYYNDDDTPSCGPSPSHSIRSGRIDFISNKSRASLTSIDPSFVMGYDYNPNRRHSTSAMHTHDNTMTLGFWDHDMPHVQRSPDENPPRQRSGHERRESDSSAISTKSFASLSSMKSVASKKSSRSVVSKASSRSVVSKASSRPRGKSDYRVEEEIVYQPEQFYMPTMMWRQ